MCIDTVQALWEYELEDTSGTAPTSILLMLL